MAAVAALGRLWIGSKQKKLEDAQEVIELNRRLRTPIAPVKDIDPIKIGVDPAVQAILDGGEVPDYIPRAADSEIHKALEAALDGTGRWIIILCGPSKAGKSRTLFEALRRQDDIELVTPTTGEAVKGLLTPGQMPPSRPGTTRIVWLDDLEVFVNGGVDLELLQEWHNREGVLFAGTYGGKGSDRLKDAGEDLTVLANILLQHAAQISMENTTGRELESLPDGLSPNTRGEIERYGLAAVLVAGPALERKLTTGRHSLTQSEVPQGKAVARAAIDWARCGRTDPMPLATLQKLWKSYLPPHASASDEDFQHGLTWSLQPVSGSISLLHESDGYLPYDYIVSFIEKRGSELPKEECWTHALEAASPLQAFSVGLRAHQFGRLDNAIEAMRMAANAEIPRASVVANFNLGVLLRENGDDQAAEDAYRKAAEMGHGAAASNLGVILGERGDFQGAEAAYRRAAELDHPAGLFNLGVLFISLNRKDEALSAFREAAESGHPSAATNLGSLLEKRGDLEGAEAAWRRAWDLGDGGGGNNLGLLLKNRGDTDVAERIFRQALDLGSGSAGFNLGLQLEQQGDVASAEEAYRRAVELDSADAAVNLGMLHKERGDIKEAEALWRLAAELGDADGACNLGLLLLESEQEDEAAAAFRQALALGDGRGGAGLGTILMKRGDNKGAKQAWQEALDLGDPDGAFNLGVLLDHEKDQDGAIAAFGKALELGSSGAGANLGVLLMQTGDQDGAEAAFRKSFELGHAGGGLNLGLRQLQAGNIEEARATFRAAMDLDPKDAAVKAEAALEQLDKGSSEQP